jgi:hypothetical protein
MAMRRHHRGITFMGVLLILGIGAGIFWFMTYGEAYWENQEVKAVLSEAANACYKEESDDKIKDLVFRKLHNMFDQQVEDHGHVVTVMKIDCERDDMRIERSKVPAYVHIWLTYNRRVKVPFVGGERVVQFTDHSEADLSPVKW